MSLRIARNRSGGYYISGLRNDFAAYERKIIQGQIPCPFTVEFRDRGEVITRKPIPLDASGKPKIKLFQGSK